MPSGRPVEAEDMKASALFLEGLLAILLILFIVEISFPGSLTDPVVELMPGLKTIFPAFASVGGVSTQFFITDANLVPQEDGFAVTINLVNRDDEFDFNAFIVNHDGTVTKHPTVFHVDSQSEQSFSFSFAGDPVQARELTVRWLGGEKDGTSDLAKL